MGGGEAGDVTEAKGGSMSDHEKWADAMGWLRAIGHALGCEGDERAILDAAKALMSERVRHAREVDEIKEEWAAQIQAERMKLANDPAYARDALIFALGEKIGAHAREIERMIPLARFGLKCFDEHRDQLGDLDGCDLQEWAEEFGLLREVHVTEPCGESCRCAEWDDFPQECLREVDAVTEFRAALAALEVKNG